MLLFQFSVLFVIFSLTGCDCDTYRIGSRRNGDELITKKVLISVPTSNFANHTMIYEYWATKFVSFIEYQIGSGCEQENVQAEIVFTGNYSLESKFIFVNVTELYVTLNVYGFEQYNVPGNFQPILVPQFLIMEDDHAPKFGVGFRQVDDELLYFQIQSSIKTKQFTNHSLEFSTCIEHFITYVSFSVDSKTAGATFLIMTEHNFSGLVYDVSTLALTAKMYVYGYKRDNVPMDYKPIFQTKKMENKDKNGKSIYLEPFNSFINVSYTTNDANVSKYNSQCEHILPISVFSFIVLIIFNSA